MLQQDNASKTLDQKDLKRIIRDLDLGNLDIALLKDLVILSSRNPVEEDPSSSPDNDKMDNMWEGGVLFRKLLASLFPQLTSDKVSLSVVILDLPLIHFTARGNSGIWVNRSMGNA